MAQDDRSELFKKAVKVAEEVNKEYLEKHGTHASHREEYTCFECHSTVTFRDSHDADLFYTSGICAKCRDTALAEMYASTLEGRLERITVLVEEIKVLLEKILAIGGERI